MRKDHKEPTSPASAPTTAPKKATVAQDISEQEFDRACQAGNSTLVNKYLNEEKVSNAAKLIVIQKIPSAFLKRYQFASKISKSKKSEARKKFITILLHLFDDAATQSEAYLNQFLGAFHSNAQKVIPTFIPFSNIICVLTQTYTGHVHDQIFETLLSLVEISASAKQDKQIDKLKAKPSMSSNPHLLCASKDQPSHTTEERDEHQLGGLTQN